MKLALKIKDKLKDYRKCRRRKPETIKEVDEIQTKHSQFIKPC
jgi:hypothetical protein